MKRMLFALALALAGCESAQPDRAVFIQALGDPPPSIVYSPLARADSIRFQSSPPSLSAPATGPTLRFDSATAANQDSVLPAETELTPAASSSVSESTIHADAHCAEYVELQPGTLRLSLAGALENQGWTMDHWFAGDGDHLFDYPLSETVRIDMTDCRLAPLADWLKTHFGLRAEFDAETRTFDIYGLQP